MATPEAPNATLTEPVEGGGDSDGIPWYYVVAPLLCLLCICLGLIIIWCRSGRTRQGVHPVFSSDICKAENETEIGKIADVPPIFTFSPPSENARDDNNSE
eukprot:TRINITY_DN31583_c0_g1_i1.p1 TRINITY_DN31583_c0_g1~~TRINITY_DN31583_c0_g1_i1.p1  ORF type:complete len:101 (+),score=4.74 TRINITY_DN31583_c0_g1_i1:66-368(+)